MGETTRMNITRKLLCNRCRQRFSCWFPTLIRLMNCVCCNTCMLYVNASLVPHPAPGTPLDAESRLKYSQCPTHQGGAYPSQEGTYPPAYTLQGWANPPQEGGNLPRPVYTRYIPPQTEFTSSQPPPCTIYYPEGKSAHGKNAIQINNSLLGCVTDFQVLEVNRLFAITYSVDYALSRIAGFRLDCRIFFSRNNRFYFS